MKETTIIFNAQITIVRDNDSFTDDKKLIEKIVKDRLNADDVVVSNLRRFEMDKE